MKSDGGGVEGQWVEDNPANKWERYRSCGVGRVTLPTMTSERSP